MAMQTYEMARLDDGAFVLSFDYDDATGVISTVRGVNSSPDRSYTVTATALANGRSYTVPVPPETTIEQAVPQAVQARLQISVVNGFLRGVNWSVS